MTGHIRCISQGVRTSVGSKELVDNWSDAFLDEEQLDGLRTRLSGAFRADLISSFDNPFVEMVPTLRPV